MAINSCISGEIGARFQSKINLYRPIGQLILVAIQNCMVVHVPLLNIEVTVSSINNLQKSKAVQAKIIFPSL